MWFKLAILHNRQFKGYNTWIILISINVPSSKGFAEFPNEDGLVPGDFSTILI